MKMYLHKFVAKANMNLRQNNKFAEQQVNRTRQHFNIVAPAHMNFNYKFHV